MIHLKKLQKLEIYKLTNTIITHMSMYSHNAKKKKQPKVKQVVKPVVNLSGIKVFTDGGTHLSNPGIGGFAYVVVENDVILHEYSELVGHSTNNRMEMMAVLHCLNWLAVHVPHLPVVICSDSQYLVNGVTLWRHGWKRKNWVDVKNDDLWRQIAEIDDLLPNVTYQWVKGHNGNKYNEMADSMCSALFQGL